MLYLFVTLIIIEVVIVLVILNNLLEFISEHFREKKYNQFSEFLEAKRFIKAWQIAIGMSLLPAFKKTTEAVIEFWKAIGKLDVGID